MFLNSRFVEDEVDLVVASLTPSQKRQTMELYGGGKPQPGSKWESVPILTTKQIKLVKVEQNSQPSHDYRMSQAGMGLFASNVPIGAARHLQSLSHPPIAHSAYPPPSHYQQGPSYASVSHPQTDGHHVAAESKDKSI